MTKTGGRVYIVDDDEAIRDSLRWLFQSRQLAAEAFDSAEAFLAACDPALAGCLVLDIRMPGMSGPELQDRLIAQGWPIPIIFLTGHGDVPMAVAALKKGAFDFAEKPFNDNQLVDLVIQALAQDSARLSRQRETASVSDRLAQLTPREREIMELILAGKFNKVIAHELNISMRTVEVHRSRILEKMGVRTAVELAQIISTRGARG